MGVGELRGEEAPRGGDKHGVGHRGKLPQRLVGVLTHAEVHLSEAVETDRAPHIDQHRDLHAVADAERQPHE